MPFTHTSSLMTELDALGSAIPPRSAGRWRPDDHEVGIVLVSMAADKFDWSETDIAGDESHQARRRSAAQRVLLTHCLRPDADDYELLGVRADASQDQIRDAYRRMIALVHPDSSPVGFPLDAASRVNLAYSTLGDVAKRAAYDEAQSTAESATSAALVTPRPRNSAGRGVPSARQFRFRASRKALLWLAALSVIPAAALLYSTFPSSSDVDLVEARPKLKLSESPSQSTPISSSPPATPSAAAASSVLTPVADTSAAAVNAPSPQLSMQLSAESERRLAGSPAALAAGASIAASAPQTTSASPDAVTVSRPARQRDALRPSPVIPPPTPSAFRVEEAAPAVAAASESTARPPEAPLAAGRVVSDSTPQQAQTVRAPAYASLKTTSASTMPAIDADDVLMRLVTAYETGSASALGRLLSPHMAGRRALLADYERIFRETTARTLRLGQLRHQRFDDRVKSSGPATVLTVSRDQQTAEQRVFLEIEIVRDRDQVFIERLASYAAK